MPFYMQRFKYGANSMKALVDKPNDRRDSAKRVIEAHGGKLREYFLSFGEYDVLVIASVIQREAITPDFRRVSRVIYNRLAAGIPLQMDSTINYPLDLQQVRTSDADRARPGPYNTYLNSGLPASPIGSPSAAAISAALKPEPGAWQYFVKCQRDGTS